MGITTKCAMKHKYKGKMLGHTPPWYECVWGPPTYLKKVKTSKKDILGCLKEIDQEKVLLQNMDLDFRIIVNFL